MSEHQPPSGEPEYLERGHGGPLPSYDATAAETPGATPASGGRGRRVWWVAGGVLALAGLGAGAWAALGFFAQGAQPAEALPSSTVAYLSVDLDPSGGQKIDAFRTLNKFPAFKDDVGVNSVDDLRHKLGAELVGQADCPGLDYDHDIDPWLGDRMAVAAVPIQGKPHLVVVVQVKDEDKARQGIATLDACDDSDDDPATSIHDGWMVLAQSQDVADGVVAAADKDTLADDPTYQKWTKELGDAGVLNAYASPDAGRYLAQQVGGLLGPNLTDGLTALPGSSAGHSAEWDAGAAYSSSLRVSSVDDPFTKALTSFKGGAATLRFTGDGLEFAMAADGSASQLTKATGNTGGTLVQRLPTDTAAAAGVSFPKGWFDRQLGQMADLFGGGLPKDDAMAKLSAESGLDLPGDLDTLLGSGVSLSVGNDFDLEAAENSDDGSGLPVAVTIKGDAAAIDRVLDKIRAKTGDLPFLGSDSAGDLVTVGPSSAYRRHVLDGGGLGDDGAFTGVVPDAGDASSVFYVNIDALEPSLTKAAAGDQETVDNLTPLRAFGMSSRNDGDTLRFSVKITTN